MESADRALGAADVSATRGRRAGSRDAGDQVTVVRALDPDVDQRLRRVGPGDLDQGLAAAVRALGDVQPRDAVVARRVCRRELAIGARSREAPPEYGRAGLPLG